MSSGVDSSVSAALYASKYPNVKGIFMANWSQTSNCIERDWNDVQRVCADLSISCERVNFEKEYWHQVFNPMIEMYQRGLTPNPDINCNKFVKFGKMIEYLTDKYQNSSKKWWLVTGHYARVMKHKPTGEYHLLRGYSQNKDQSYYLSSISSQTLSKILMPIGHYIKPRVRELAEEFKLHVSDKPDSQGLCFVSQDAKHFRDFLDEYIESNPGNIITEDGKIWGKHRGLWYATIGQKSSISMPQGDEQYNGVWFVSEKNYDKNELVIVRGSTNPKLFKSRAKVINFEWMITPEEISQLDMNQLTFQYQNVINEAQSSTFTVEFKTPVRALAPGQSFVIYQDCRILGSGIIDETFS
ncbi:tRNA-specific 2-thiouridylase [Scheffersomyces coipomensis]|uniref:tRNA-specific 2-thiouridylase n=1 Tax=Scheffersomyces coipomensis TaxID=1788519 RepID=UPI00315C9141